MMTANVMSGMGARWLLGVVILASSVLAPGPARAATGHPGGAPSRPAPVGKVAAPKLKQHELAMRPAPRRASNASLGSKDSTISAYRPKINLLALSASAAPGLSVTRGGRHSGLPHAGIDGSAVRPRK
jgi:hypothetical protein